MKHREQAHAEQAAERDLAAYFQRRGFKGYDFPLDLDDFLRRQCALEIMEVNMGQLQFEGLADNRILGGLYPTGYFFNGRDRVVIVDSRIAVPGRKRFTLAHEAGHYSLHVRAGGAEIYNRAAGPFLCRNPGGSLGRGEYQRDALEHHADCYASALLMPAAYFPRLVTGGRVQIDLRKYGDELQRRFGVSRQAAEIRLQGLGYGLTNGKYHNRELGTGERAFQLLERMAYVEEEKLSG